MSREAPVLNSHAAVIQYERTLDCIHCGLCLPACPTYELFGRETTGPRGRIYLLRALAEERIDPSPEVIRDLDLCLVCRACEPVCPSGVHFGALMEYGRSAILEPARKTTLKDRLRRTFLRRVLTRPARLRRLAWLLRAYETSGLRGLLRRYGVLHYLSRDLALRDALLPTVPPRRERRPLARVERATIKPRGRVALLEGCVMPLLLGAVNRATVRVLTRQGFDVVLPDARPCCGALAAHFGALDVARRQALLTVRAYADLGDVEAIVVNSAGCGAAMKEYGRLLADDPAVSAMDKAAARAFSEKVKDVSEFLIDRGLRPLQGRVEARVAYADACHLAHAQRITAAPRALLAAVPGVEAVPLDRPDRCCGAAGLYNALQPAEATALLDDRIDDLVRSGANVLASANPGCLLQWKSGVTARGLDVEVVHPIELLDRAGGG